MTDEYEDLAAHLVVRKLSTLQRAGLYVRGMLAGFPPGFPLDFSVYTRNSQSDAITREGWSDEMLLNRSGGIIKISNSRSGAKTLRFVVPKQKLIQLYEAFKISNTDELVAQPYRVSSTLHKTSVVSIIAWGKESGVAYGTGVKLTDADKSTIWDVLAEIEDLHGYRIREGELLPS